MNINDNATPIYVKGFARTPRYNRLMPTPDNIPGKFFAFITDMLSTDYVEVTSAVQQDDKWLLTATDGTAYTFEQEPDTPREMKYGKLITELEYGKNSSVSYVQLCSQHHYENAKQRILNGFLNYHLLGYIAGKEVITSPVVKLWIEPNGQKHGITRSNSHYVF